MALGLVASWASSRQITVRCVSLPPPDVEHATSSSMTMTLHPLRSPCTLTRSMLSLGPLTRLINHGGKHATTPARRPAAKPNAGGDVRLQTRRHDRRPNALNARRVASRVVEEKRQPHRASASQACLGRQSRPSFTPPIFPQGGAAIRVQIKGDSGKTSLEHGLPNALIESTDTKIRVLTRMAYGFKSPDALIALSLGGHRPDLPGRKLAA